MVSLLGAAIFSGVGTALGNKAVAEREKQDKLDQIRAEKLATLDINLELENARSKNQLELEREKARLEKEKESSFDFKQWSEGMKSLGYSKEDIDKGSFIISQGGKPAQVTQYMTSQDYKRDIAETKKEDEIKASVEDSLGQPIKLQDVKDTELNPYTFSKRTNRAVGETLNPLASKYMATAVTVFKTESGRNKYTNPVIQQMVKHATALDDVVNQRTYNMEDPVQKQQYERSLEDAKRVIASYENGEVPGVDPEDFAKLLKQQNPQTAEKIKNLIKQIEQSPNNVNKESTEEVNGPVMPNEVKPSPADLPPVENYPEGKILRNPDTGERIKKVNGAWVKL